MKYKIFILTFIFFPCFLNAQQVQKLSVDNVIVYLKAAQLNSSAKISLPKGETEVVFTNVAGNIQKPTLIVSATNDVIIESTDIKNDFLQDENKSPELKKITDSIESIDKQLQALKIKSDVLDENLDVLKQNTKVSGNNISTSTIDLKKMIDFVTSETTEILNSKSVIETQTKSLSEKKDKLQAQLNEEQQKALTPGGQLVVKFFASQATTSDIAIQYVVPDAGWVPSYDVHADKTNRQVGITFKASVYQDCGIKWTNIKITLSTGNPSQGAQAPKLTTDYLSLEQPSSGLNEVVVVGYGFSRNQEAEDNDSVDRKVEAKVSGLLVSINNEGISTDYDIDLPYTIPADGQSHLIQVKDITVPAVYHYISIPKIDEDAFLEAQITNWETLNLLPAQTNVFYEGAFVGNGFLDTKNTTDTLNISFGRDKKIIIKREKSADYSSVKFLGSNTRRQSGYNISIRNTRNEAINIIIKDQFPVSTTKDIEVSDQQADGASINTESGTVIWDLQVQPNDTKKVSIKYTVKYPKDRVVQGL